VIVGDAGQQRPLGDELIAEVAADDLDRRLDGWEDLGQRVEVLSPGLARNLLRRSGHHARLKAARSPVQARPLQIGVTVLLVLATAGVALAVLLTGRSRAASERSSAWATAR
jgi:hypothetical protein